MSEISAEQRQKAKAAAGNAAVAANDMAVVLGAGGAVIAVAGVASGVGALAGVVAGGTLAVCSFSAWLIANRYQRLANDPPRADFAQVTTSAASIADGALSADEPLATAERFAAQQLVLADALGALVTSIERFDGATEAGDSASAGSQTDAVQANAHAAMRAGEALATLAAPLNEAWTATVGTVDWNAVSLEQAQDFLRSALGNPAIAQGTPLNRIVAAVSDPVEPLMEGDVSSHPLLTSVEMPGRPAALVDDGFLQLLATLSEALEALVVTENA